MDGNCLNGQRCVLTDNGYQKTCVSGEYVFMIIMIILMIMILTVTVTVILIAMVIAELPRARSARAAEHHG